MSNKVGNLVKYPRVAGKGIDLKRDAEVIRKDGVFTERYIERVNTNTKLNGMKIIVNSKKTKEYEEACLKENEKRQKQAELKQSIASANLATALGVNQEKSGKGQDKK